MAYPSDHLYPPELPRWLLADHQLVAGERVQATAFEQGEDRQRELYTFTPWMVSVTTTLKQAQFDRFAEWWDDDLQAGTQAFDTQLAALNGRFSQWWQARFMGPYRASAIHGGLHIVSAELILLDGPYDEDNLPAGYDPGDPPRIARSVMARGYVETQGRVTVAAGTVRAWGITDTEGRVVVNRTVRARGLVETDGQVIVDVSYLLLEDGSSFLLFEDSGRIILEP